MSIAFSFAGGLTSVGPSTPLLRLTGPGAFGFLQRLSTQNLPQDPTQARLLAMLDKKGRIQELGQARVMADEVLFLGWPGTKRAPQQTLEPFHFAEDLEMSEILAEVCLVVGPSSLAPYEAATAENVFLWGAPSVLSGDKKEHSYWVFSEEEGAVDAYLSSHDVDKGSDAEWENLRIQTGWPAFGAEASTKSNPLELELHDALSWTKGCYVGQEVISRIDNYDKQTRRLLGVRLDHALTVSPGDEVEVLFQSSTTGKFTSLAPDGKHALAMLKIPPDAVEGIAVELQIKGVVVGTGQAYGRHFAQVPHDD